MHCWAAASVTETLGETDLLSLLAKNRAGVLPRAGSANKSALPYRHLATGLGILSLSFCDLAIAQDLSGKRYDRPREYVAEMSAS